jgi:glycosidase
MNFSDNHDEKRAIARFGEGGALAASALVFALDGVPMIYNGMEAGDTTESGGPALFAHLPVFWPIASRRPEFLTTYQTLIRLRRENAALRRGTLTWLTTGDDVRLVAFARGTGAEQSVFVVNLSNRPFAGSVKVQDAGGWADAQTGAAVDLSRIGLEAWGWKFYRRATL